MPPGTTAPAPAARPPPATAPAAAPIRTQLLSSVAKVALTAALVCGGGGGGGPAAAVVVVPAAAHAVPFVRPPPTLQGKPFAASTPYAQSQKLQLGLDKLGFVYVYIVCRPLHLFLTFACIWWNSMDDA